MVRTLIALVTVIVNRASVNPRVVELVGAGALTVGMVQWFGAAAGWATVGGALLLKAWGDDVARAARDKARSQQ